jgi:hypothetical protein
MRVKAMILLLVFCGILILPFAVHAGAGTLFEGLPIPDFNDSAAADDPSEAADDEGAAQAQYDAGAAQYNAVAAQYANCPPPAAPGSGLSAAQEQYAQSLPRPEVGSESVQMSISIDDMRNHMDVLDQEGRTTDQCLACHTNREEFCDRCHSYSGVSPTFD